MSDADTLAAVTTRLTGLPPDPDGLNDKRAEAARVGMAAYVRHKSTDDESCLYDLLVDLRHWADRNGKDFDDTVKRSQKSYDDET